MDGGLCNVPLHLHAQYGSCSSLNIQKSTYTLTVMEKKHIPRSIPAFHALLFLLWGTDNNCPASDRCVKIVSVSLFIEYKVDWRFQHRCIVTFKRCTYRWPGRCSVGCIVWFNVSFSLYKRPRHTSPLNKTLNPCFVDSEGDLREELCPQLRYLENKGVQW